MDRTLGKSQKEKETGLVNLKKKKIGESKNSGVYVYVEICGLSDTPLPNLIMRLQTLSM